MILRPNWNPANPAGAKISSNESISPSAGCLPSDSARSPAKQRASASTSHVTNRLLEYRRGSWSDSVHSWFREMTRFDRRGEPSNMLMDDGRAFFRLVLVSLGHRIVSTYCWNAEFLRHTDWRTSHKSIGPSRDVNLRWHNGPIRTQTPNTRFRAAF